MPTNIESFVKTLESEGVDAGRKAAQKIEAEAKDKAEKIIFEAKETENQIIAEAQAEAEKVKSGVMVSYLQIRSPFPGLITERKVDPGAFVRPASNGGSPMIAMERVDRVRAVLFVPMRVASSFKHAKEVNPCPRS